MFRPKSLLAVAAALALTFGVRSASADIAVYDLTVPNSGITGYPSPYVQVTVNEIDSTHATITYDSVTTGGYTYLLAPDNGNGNALVGANVTGSGVFSVQSWLPVTSPTVTTAVNVHMDGFQNFDVGAIGSSGGGPSNSYTEVVLSLTRTDGGTWANAVSVLDSTAAHMLAAHVGVIDLANPGTPPSFVTTGYADGATLTAAPEPSTLAIAGLGALGFMGYGLRRCLKK